MTYSISKDFAFSASHQLDGLPEGHQCAWMHGHNYVVRVQVMADEVDAVGFVVDYGELGPLRALLDEGLDHRHLNDVLPGNPTAENLARWIHGRAAGILGGGCRVAVGVSETPKTWAWYTP